MKIFLIRVYQMLQQYRWFCVLDIIVTQIWFVIRNPSYVFFSIIALTLGTMGVWIDLLPAGLDGLAEYENKINKISVFTFCIATLGSFATESYFESNNAVKSDSELNRNLGVFFWSICLFLTFYSYVGNGGGMLGFWSTIIFWLVVNIEKPAFRNANPKAMNNMAATDDIEQQIGGPGL